MPGTREETAHGSVQFINPDGLPKNPAFTNVAVVTGSVKTIYVGGQNAVDESGIVGKGDIGVQTEQVLRNLQTALAAGGAEKEHLIKLNIYILQGQSLQPGLEAFQRVWGKPSNPPLITVVYVAGLGNPDFLLEMDAVAVVPQ